MQGPTGEERARPLFHVRFAFDRTPLRRMHAALASPPNPYFDILPVRNPCFFLLHQAFYW